LSNDNCSFGQIIGLKICLFAPNSMIAEKNLWVWLNKYSHALKKHRTFKVEISRKAGDFIEVE
jgi:hypothetical protein